MKEIGSSHHLKHNPNKITKSHREDRKSKALLKQDFLAEELLTKYVTDITEIKGNISNLIFLLFFIVLILA